MNLSMCVAQRSLALLSVRRCTFLLALCILTAPPLHAQTPQLDLNRFVGIPAVSGYEQELASTIKGNLRAVSPKTDNLGNVYVTLGSGSPHRLLVAPMDEPGYIVSAITADGYVRVQRLPQTAPHPLFDLLHSAQPVWVMTRTGKRVPGVIAGLSVHLLPARVNPPKMNHPDEMYIDVGASSAAEVRAAGVDLLDPITLNRQLYFLGNEQMAGAAVGDRFGCAALMEILRSTDAAKLNGTLTVAFVTQQWTGVRGLDRLLQETHPDEMILVNRIFTRRPAVAGAPPGTAPLKGKPGTGLLLGVSDSSAELSGLALDLKHLAESKQIKVTAETSAPLRPPTAPALALPQRYAQLSVPLAWPATPGEILSGEDLKNLTDLLEAYVAAPSQGDHGGPLDEVPDTGRHSTIETLINTYGASGHEENVRQAIQKLLPKWAKTETDPAGNLVLHVGKALPGSKTPRIAIVAHMDEIGYQVKSIADDGRLVVSVLGGGFTEYYLGHVVLVHASQAERAGVLELPSGADRPGFEWPRSLRAMDEPVRVDVGASSPSDVEKLGIKVGDSITIPKKYRPLLGHRANGRSFDDRVGCAALVEAVRMLAPDLPGRDVTFVWSTEEEVGLKGAAVYAERVAQAGQAPDYVFAVDTFVSSDSPLESKRFADAEIGKGFVIRAVDGSNITSRSLVDRVVKLARANNIPVQYGVTGGGNDGSAFLKFGTVDIPLAWPLRYSHSPGEVIDTRDLDAL
ncbi:MAG TPA: M20/M25/M40 family metallo-hydrolase, partial [Candidatus Acidoferrales bacterium]|nr:M20/M25/M40 family metallo-hydrolase [Candidatus Acidoferrales bacterium]